MTWEEFKNLVEVSGVVNNSTPVSYIDYDSGLLATKKFYLKVLLEEDELVVDMFRIDTDQTLVLSDDSPENYSLKDEE